jgi:uncharacterized membrane protein YkvA (DUF1232 family)
MVRRSLFEVQWTVRRKAARLAPARMTGHIDGMALAGTAFDPETLRREFWRKLGRMVPRIPFAEDLLAAYYCAFDRETPTHVKALLLGALAYFVLPTDTVPDMLPIIGFTDDAAVLAATVKLVTDNITPVHRQAAQSKLAEFERS